MNHSEKATVAALCSVLFLLLLSVSPQPADAQGVPRNERARAAGTRAESALGAALSQHNLRWGAPVFMRIFKEEKKLEVWLLDGNAFRLFKTYPVCTYGYGRLGPKTREGDGQAPEGFYFVTPGRMKPDSDYHLAFDLGYPNAYDRYHRRTGSYLMVHGSCVSIGCYAMTDRAIEEIYSLADAALRQGQPFFRVHIFPFRMTDENMLKRIGWRWFDFWMNLKEGYDLFESRGHNPPNVTVRDGRYRFESCRR